jgi:hypothetical protein
VTCVSGDPEDVFAESRFDGVMGLGPPDLAISGTTSLIASFVRSGKIDQSHQYFTFFLTPSSGQDGSVFNIGWLDSSLFLGSIRYYNVVPGRKHWALNLKKVCVGDWCSSDCATFGCVAVPDTGTSLISGPEVQISQIESRIGTINSDCTGVSNLPVLSFYIENDRYTLTGSEYVFKFVDAGRAECSKGLFGMTMPPEFGQMWILGDLFLKKYFSVFDVGNNKVGLAEAASR